MSPTIVVDRKAKGGERLTVPVGAAVNKMLRLGSVPMRVRCEVQYSVVRPEPYGTQWNVRLQVVPVVRNPFAK